MATTIQFAGSTDISSTYNIYDSGISGVVPLVITANIGAGTGTISTILSNLTVPFTGTRYIVVRSLLGGIESGNSVALAIVYVEGAVNSLAPTQPQVTSITTVGRILTVKYTIDMLNQPATPTLIQLFTSTSTVFDYTTELSHSSIGTTTARFMTGSVSGTVAGNGNYYFAIRSETAALKQSQNTDIYGPVRLSTVAPPDPTFSVRGQ